MLDEKFWLYLHSSLNLFEKLDIMSIQCT